MSHAGQYLGVAERAADVKAVGANALLLSQAYATGPGARGWAYGLLCLSCMGRCTCSDWDCSFVEP